MTANPKSAKNRSEKIFCTLFITTGLSHLFKMLFQINILKDYQVLGGQPDVYYSLG